MVAKLESTDSSNRIEGIATSDVRLKKLMDKKRLRKIAVKKKFLAIVMF